MKKLFPLLFAVVFVLSCRQPKELIYTGVENFSIKQAGTKQATLSMDISLYNPNNYKLKLKKADVDVFLNGSYLGKMNVNGVSALMKEDTSSLPVLLVVDLKNILPNAIQLLLNPEVTVKLSGNIVAGRHGVYINLPVNYEGKQDIRSGMNW